MNKMITGSMILKYCINPFQVWCDLFAPKEEKDAENKYLNKLIERGIEHEKQVRKSLFPNAKEISEKSIANGFSKVKDFCSKGEKIIAGAPLVWENLQGIADILVKEDGDSSFGIYKYGIKEIKSAKNMKYKYIMQAAFYNYIIGKIQNKIPEKFSLINRDNEEFVYKYAEYHEDLMMIIKEVGEIMSGKKISPTAKACSWPWENYCNKRAIEEEDVSIISMVGDSIKNKLNRKGIFKVKDVLFAKDIDVPPQMLEKIKTNAKAWLDKKPILLEKPNFKESETELYFDFEGTDELPEEDMTKIDYLVGVVVKTKTNQEFHAFVSKELKGEKEMILKFIEFIRTYPASPIYHYGSYEKTHLKTLAKKYNFELSDILPRLVDLLPILKKSVALPILTFSLKDVGKFIGCSWKGTSDAQESIAIFLEYLETKDEKLLNRIIQYNEDDVNATVKVKEFLEQQY